MSLAEHRPIYAKIEEFHTSISDLNEEVKVQGTSSIETLTDPIQLKEKIKELASSLIV